MDESPAGLRPFSEEVAEPYKIKDGKISALVAVMTGWPHGGASGWSDSLR